jgi:hypothetical protein
MNYVFMRRNAVTAQRSPAPPASLGKATETQCHTSRLSARPLLPSLETVRDRLRSTLIDLHRPGSTPSDTVFVVRYSISGLAPSHWFRGKSNQIELNMTKSNLIEPLFYVAASRPASPVLLRKAGENAALCPLTKQSAALPIRRQPGLPLTLLMGRSQISHSWVFRCLGNGRLPSKRVQVSASHPTENFYALYNLRSSRGSKHTPTLQPSTIPLYLNFPTPKIPHP